MTLLIIFVVTAIFLSFLCSIWEAVLLSVTTAHIKVLEQQGSSAAPVLNELKSDINKPLTAILTLNTIAHTVGAVGSGAQAVAVFGNQWVGLFSALMTLGILVFSEIIPKTLGATYWRGLSGFTAHSLKILIKLLYPLVVMSEFITRSITKDKHVEGFNREEFAAMADLGEAEGQLEKRESQILKNLFQLRKTLVTDAMTPRIVVFSVQQDITVSEYFEQYRDTGFSRIPIYQSNKEILTGFVLKDELILAQAHQDTEKKLIDFVRELYTLSNRVSLADAFDEVLHQRAHIMAIVDDYGGMEGILTMEDILETLLGLEIMDESDHNSDMQEYARKLWQKRAEKMGIQLPKQN